MIIIILMDLFESLRATTVLSESKPETNFPGLKEADDNF